MALLSRAALAAVVVAAATCLPHAAVALRPGDPMPALALESWSGAAATVAAPASGVLVVEIWASWCRPCREALPALADLLAATGDSRLQVAAVSIDGDRAAADRFAVEVLGERQLPLYRDPAARVPATLGAPGMPVTVVAVDGVVRSVAVGFSPQAAADLRAVVTAALGRAATTPGITADSLRAPH